MALRPDDDRWLAVRYVNGGYARFAGRLVGGIDNFRRCTPQFTRKNKTKNALPNSTCAREIARRLRCRWYPTLKTRNQLCSIAQQRFVYPQRSTSYERIKSEFGIIDLNTSSGLCSMLFAFYIGIFNFRDQLGIHSVWNTFPTFYELTRPSLVYSTFVTNLVYTQYVYCAVFNYIF